MLIYYIDKVNTLRIESDITNSVILCLYIKYIFLGTYISKLE